MANRIGPLAYILFLTFGCQLQFSLVHSFSVKSAMKLAMSSKDIVSFAFEVWDCYDKINDEINGDETQNMLKELDTKISDKLDNLSYNIKDLKQDMHMQFSKLDTKLSTQINVLFKLFNRADELYERYLEARNDTDLFLDMKERDLFVNKALGFTEILDQMHKEINPGTDFIEGILSTLSSDKNIAFMCSKNVSPQYAILHIYNLLTEKEIKVMLAQLYAGHLIETGAVSANLTNAARKSEEKIEKWQKRIVGNFEKRMTGTLQIVQRFMKMASREIWKCDPLRQTRSTNPTYSKIEVFQGFINFKRDFTEQKSCAQTCEDRVADSSSCQFNFCQRDSFKEKRCNGKLKNCKSFEHPAKLCFAPISSSRRYDWLESASGKYGQVQQNCYHDKSDLIEERIPFSEFFTSFKTFGKSISNNNCGYCLCTCESGSNNINRFFSLSESVADIHTNMVVTGARLLNEDNVFYIQIKQGQLGPKGSIVGKTHWKEISKVDVYNDNKVYNISSEQNTIYLDDVEPQPRVSGVYEVVTGLRFKKVDASLRLEVQRRAFDYTTGELSDTRNWYFNGNSVGSRGVVNIDGAADPTTEQNNAENSQSNQLLHFEITDLHKDLGQSTIPFIDIQPIETLPAIPISGAGLFHRAAGDSGGFLALKLMHYDYSTHFIY